MRQILRYLYLLFIGFFKRPKPGIHILNGHYVTSGFVDEKGEAVFKQFLERLSKTCRFITIQEAVNLIINKQYPDTEALVAFTFDDGFEECHSIIAPLLEKYNCNAAFFINANYISSNEEYQGSFNNRIKTYTKKPMTWDQVTDLHKRGHIIGSHTLDHVNLANLNDEEVEYQLSENKRILETKLGYKCEYFAWTYGQKEHYSETAFKRSMIYYKYIFSANNYKFYSSFDGKVINRRHIESFWPKGHINFFLSVVKK